MSDPTKSMRDAFFSDPEYAWGWHCNIACLLLDEGVDQLAANRRAQGFMKRAFDVEGYEPKAFYDEIECVEEDE